MAVDGLRQRQPGQAGRRRRAGFGRALLLLLGLGLAIASPAQLAALDATTRFRATFLHRLAHFFVWPDATFAGPQAPVRICVDGRDVRNLAAALTTQVAAKQVAGRPIEIKAFAKGEALTDCHLAYLVILPAVGEALPPMADSTVLIVESLDALQRAGALALVMEVDPSGKGRLVIHAHAERLHAVKATANPGLLQVVRYHVPAP